MMTMTTPSPYRQADPLGEEQADHPVAGAPQVIRLGLGLFCILVAVDCVWLGMWPRAGQILWEALIVTGIIALIFFWLAWDAFSHYARARKQRISLHEFGVRIHDGKTHQDVRFDDIVFIGGVLWQTPGQAPPAGAVLWIDDVQGRRIEVPSPHARAHELGQSIRGSTFERRRAWIESQLAHGKTVSFGRVKLDPLLIAVDGRIIPRSSIDTVDIFVRYFRIVIGKDVVRIATEEIPNADVLVTLLQK